MHLQNIIQLFFTVERNCERGLGHSMTYLINNDQKLTQSFYTRESVLLVQLGQSPALSGFDHIFIR